LTRSDRVIGWIEEHCRVPEGKDVGKPVVLREWQKAELRKIYDNPHGTRQAILSFPRKNGKTALIAFLLLVHLCGPEAKPNSQLYSSALSKEQAATVYNLAAKMVRQSPVLAEYVICRDTVKELACPEIGTKYAALSADKSTAHGKSPVFAVHDELGQVKGPTSELYEAVETGMGAHEAPLSIVISTQAPTDADLLSTLIDGALSGADPKTVVSLYSAPMGADPFEAATLQACNPAWGDFLNADEVLRQMNNAKNLPSLEPGYRNLHLNQRVDATSPFISRSTWEKCGGDVVPSFAGLKVYGGLDLSETADLTAFVAAASVGAVWHVKPTFWLPGAGLKEKSRSDRVPYDLWAKQGHLQATPGQTVDYEYVSAFLWAFCAENDVECIGFDRWNYRHLKPWLYKAGFSERQIEGDAAIFKELGQGFQTMSPALRDLETVVLNGRMAHGRHPVLEMCAANAVVVTDPAGNRKLAKNKSSGRIDGMVALAMAMAVAVEEDHGAAPTPWDLDPDFRLVG
jgi:phage terminase large subunit-like protein